MIHSQDNFARHRMDKGRNKEFNVKLTRKTIKQITVKVYRFQPTWKKDLIVDLALMHEYGIITVLLFSNYAGPIFAHRKPNGKLRLLVDFRKINSLIADDYTNNNHPTAQSAFC